MSNNQVYLLSRNDINTWDKIDEMPIVETAPRSVPLSSFITVPPEGYYKHLISQKSELPAVENVSTINLIKEDIILLDYYLSNFYSQRGLTPPLFAYIEKLKQQAGTTLMPDSFKTPQVKEIAKGILVPQVNFLKAEKEASEEIIDHFYHIFTNEKIWKDGEYCNELKT
ncbi:hypothetical protein GPJ56_002939 [Histomonas meleagridis]|nr:hypothetical protein GPJ56_002939 [Histomonas meleagridis]